VASTDFLCDSDLIPPAHRLSVSPLVGVPPPPFGGILGNYILDSLGPIFAQMRWLTHQFRDKRFQILVHKVMLAQRTATPVELHFVGRWVVVIGEPNDTPSRRNLERHPNAISQVNNVVLLKPCIHIELPTFMPAILSGREANIQDRDPQQSHRVPLTPSAA
jgi:hypothetical protein